LKAPYNYLFLIDNSKKRGGKSGGCYDHTRGWRKRGGKKKEKSPNLSGRAPTAVRGGDLFSLTRRSLLPGRKKKKKGGKGKCGTYEIRTEGKKDRFIFPLVSGKRGEKREKKEKVPRARLCAEQMEGGERGKRTPQ